MNILYVDGHIIIVTIVTNCYYGDKITNLIKLQCFICPFRNTISRHHGCYCLQLVAVFVVYIAHPVRQNVTFHYSQQILHVLKTVATSDLCNNCIGCFVHCIITVYVILYTTHKEEIYIYKIFVLMID